MRSSLFLSLAASAGIASATKPRFVLYHDEWHRADLPNREATAGVTHVIQSFANSSLFSAEPAGEYVPFQPVEEIRALFSNETKVCLALGGWGDTAGFSEGAKTPESRARFAKNVADTLTRLNYDCVDIDWEYPGGNGQDYKQNPNSSKKDEVKTYPKLLAEIKKAVGRKELSIAVPGLDRDMIAYNWEQVPKINKIVDSVHVMTYDLINRRDKYTAHHTSFWGSMRSIDKYLALGFSRDKLTLGIAFYAKYFTTKKGYKCDFPSGCPLEVLEDPKDGSDTGKSGAVTFEKANFEAVPAELTLSPDSTCGAGTAFKCAEGGCCAASGWCGETSAHCGTGCQHGFGKCEGIDVKGSFQTALAQGRQDLVAGGQWYWDAENRLYWTWDTPELIAKKMDWLSKAYGIKSVMAWSMGEDSHDWSHLKAIQKSFVKK